MVAARATSAAQRTAGTAIAWCKPSWVLNDERTTRPWSPQRSKESYSSAPTEASGTRSCTLPDPTAPVAASTTASADALGQRHDDPLRSAHVGHAPDVLVLADAAVAAFERRANNLLAQANAYRDMSILSLRTSPNRGRGAPCRAFWLRIRSRITLPQQPDQALPQQHRVVGYHHPHPATRTWNGRGRTYAVGPARRQASRRRRAAFHFSLSGVLTRGFALALFELG